MAELGSPTFSIRFFERDFSKRMVIPRVDFVVDRYSFSAIGGPDKARISVTGDTLELARLAGWLRVPVEIYDDTGQIVWWGYINEVKVQLERRTRVFSLEEMGNSIAVNYSTRSTGSSNTSSRGKTNYAEDAESIAEYGRKQRVFTMSNGTLAAANTYRDLLLDRFKIPVRKPEFRETRDEEVELLCLGWWHTLGWQYYTEDSATELYDLDANHDISSVNFGDNTTHKVAQTFTVTSSTDYKLEAIDFQLAKVGAPTDNLQLNVYVVKSAAPDALVETSTALVGDSLSTALVYEEFAFTSTKTLTSLAQYWIEVTRTGAQDTTNYYQIGVDNNALYADGQFYTHDGATWTADATKDAPFLVAGVRDTGEQIELLFDDDNAGQFITGRDVPATNAELPAQGDGRTTGLSIIKQVLELGNSDGKRLVAYITALRRAVIEAEPTAGIDDLRMLSHEIFENRFGQMIPKHWLHAIVRQWARPVDDISLPVNKALFADEVFFLEEVDYDVRRDRLRIRAKDSTDTFDLQNLALKDKTREKLLFDLDALVQATRDKASPL